MPGLNRSEQAAVQLPKDIEVFIANVFNFLYNRASETQGDDKMIDMHNHVLYGVDDGAQSIEDSVEMLFKAKEVGFSGVVLTPHYMCYQNFTSPVAENKKRCETLKKILERAGLELNLYLGSELLYEYQLVDLIDKEEFTTLAGTPWFLVETIRHGGTAIGVQNFMHKLKEKGYKAMIQCNYLSLIGYYGEPSRRTLEILLKHRMVQLMGSDAHQVEGYERYPEARAAGIALVGEDEWNRIMCRNPELLIKNKGGIAVNPIPCTEEVKSSVIGRTFL